MMEARKLGQIIAFKQAGKLPVGFHASNLEVATLSEELWQELSNPDKTEENSEALRSLVEWSHSQNQDVKPDIWNSDKGLKAITLNVTQVCNLACKYCAAGGNGTYGDPVKRITVEKTIPQLKSLMARATPGEAFQITFLGGEPLLYPDGIRILADVARTYAEEFNLKLNFVVVTNGTQFSPANIELLGHLKANITVSIDGNADVNDSRRPTRSGRGMTSTVISGLKQLLRHKADLGEIGLAGVFGKNNLDLMSAYEFYRVFDVDWFDFTFDHFETNPEISDLYLEDLRKVAARAFAEEGEAGLRRIKIFNHYFSVLDNQQRIENHCGAGQNFLMVDARNQVTTCPWLVGEAKEVVGVGETIWEDRLTAYTDSLIEKNGCGNCWARYMCGGGCMYVHRNKTGDKHSVDTNFCERTKRILQTSFEYYLECRS